MRRVRGKEMAMVFQDPMTSLDPVYRIGNQIIELLRIHETVNKKEAYQRAVELLRMVGLPDPEMRMNRYPHQLSGGQRQRVMIAMVLACTPKLLIADEPKSATSVYRRMAPQHPQVDYANKQAFAGHPRIGSDSDGDAFRDAGSGGV